MPHKDNVLMHSKLSRFSQKEKEWKKFGSLIVPEAWANPCARVPSNSWLKTLSITVLPEPLLFSLPGTLQITIVHATTRLKSCIPFPCGRQLSVLEAILFTMPEKYGGPLVLLVTVHLPSRRFTQKTYGIVKHCYKCSI